MPTNPTNARRRRRPAYTEHDRRRGSAASRGYGHAHRRWREQVLALHPLCVVCKAGGRVEVATVADHITPIVVDAALALDLDNGRGLCERHHAIITDNFKRNGINEMPAQGGLP